MLCSLASFVLLCMVGLKRSYYTTVNIIIPKIMSTFVIIGGISSFMSFQKLTELMYITYDISPSGSIISRQSFFSQIFKLFLVDCFVLSDSVAQNLYYFRIQNYINCTLPSIRAKLAVCPIHVAKSRHNIIT